MSRIKKILLSILIFLSLVLAFVGRMLDISEPPGRADALYVFGGDWHGGRVKKALKLYRKKYANKIILNLDNEISLEEGNRIYKTEKSYLLANNVPYDALYFIQNAGNTMFEIRNLKNLCIQKHIKKLMVISHPAHLYRIRMLMDRAEDYKNANIEVVYIENNEIGWDKNRWFLDTSSRKFVFSELIKIPGNYMTYIVLDKNGLLDPIRKNFGFLLYPIKSFFQKIIILLN